ncbi:hypothetical protein K438DRAFT_1973560 [Mycena galopus ATCC 62051]|nr:hypothetical protein K438DRAFT_1973560 [Mycena galopus ATCC 62051]
MKANNDDVAKLEQSLDSLITVIKASGAFGALKQRLDKLSLELQVTAAKCRKLAEAGRLKRFFKAKDEKEKIQSIQSLIVAQIHQFMFESSISIEECVQVMTSERM